MARCFVTRELPGPALDRLRKEHEVEVWDGRLPPSSRHLVDLASRADGLLCLLTDTVDGPLLDATGVRVVSNYAVGIDNIDLAAAVERRIPVGHTPDVLTEATADLTFALILAAARRLGEGIDHVRSGDWDTWHPAHMLGPRRARHHTRDHRHGPDRPCRGSAR